MTAPPSEPARRRRGRRSKQRASAGEEPAARTKRSGKRHRSSRAEDRESSPPPRKQRTKGTSRKGGAKAAAVPLVRSPEAWNLVSSWAPVIGFALVAILVWGVVFRNDVWSARTFVLLFYGALLSTVVAYLGPWWMARRGWPPVRPWVNDFRGGLSVFVVVFVSWAWLPFLTRPFVGWCMRMVSFLRYF